MDKKPTKVQIALQFAGGVRCACGSKMELHERDNKMGMETEFYFICTSCRKWTGVEKIHANLPIADIMDRIQLMERRVKPLKGDEQNGNQQERV